MPSWVHSTLCTPDGIARNKLHSNILYHRLYMPILSEITTGPRTGGGALGRLMEQSHKETTKDHPPTTNTRRACPYFDNALGRARACLKSLLDPSSAAPPPPCPCLLPDFGLVSSGGGVCAFWAGVRGRSSSPSVSSRPPLLLSYIAPWVLSLFPYFDAGC
jgi:hypothetical protein